MKSVKYASLSSDEVRQVREDYVAFQHGKCYCCHGDLNKPPLAQESYVNPIDWKLFPGGKEGFLKYSVHLHHSHKTGMTLGAVHAFCNAWMWYYRGE